MLCDLGIIKVEGPYPQQVGGEESFLPPRYMLVSGKKCIVHTLPPALPCSLVFKYGLVGGGFFFRAYPHRSSRRILRAPCLFSL